MNNEQNWYRQLFALVLLSGARAAVEFITNPGSREDATDKLRSAFQEIDYDALARAVTSAIDDFFSSIKVRLSDTIDTLRDRSVDAVDEAKNRAEKQVGKKGGGKLRLLFALSLGGIIAYFLLDEQRRDDLLDRLTGASGPIQSSSQSVYQQAASTAESATNRPADTTTNTAPESTSETQV